MMKRNLLLGIVLAVCSLGIVKGQTVSDSLAIVSAAMEDRKVPKKGLSISMFPFLNYIRSPNLSA